MEISKELAREIILDHYQDPQAKVASGKDYEGKYLKGHNDSPSCVDNIDGYVLVEDGIVKDAKFTGVGCAICTSSTDILTLKIIGKKVAEAKVIITNYLNMIVGEKFDEEIIEDLIIYKDINKQANRVKCAMTGIQAIQKALDQAPDKKAKK